MGEKEKIKNGILIATVGIHSQVVTMALNKLLEDGHIIRKVIVIHTHDDGQDKDLTKSIECLKEEFIQNEDGVNINLYSLFPNDDSNRQRVINVIKKTNDSLIEDKLNGILEIKLDMKEIKKKVVEEDGNLRDEFVKDIDSIENANAAQDAIYKAVVKEMSQSEIVICLAGGRKTMSGADAIAALTLNVKILCHVTEPKKPFNELYQPPLKEYQLVEMPVPNIYKLIEHAQANSKDFNNIFDEGANFRNRLTELSEYSERISLLSGLTNAHDLAKNRLLIEALNSIPLCQEDTITITKDKADDISKSLELFIEYLKILDNIYEQLIGKRPICKSKVNIKTVLSWTIDFTKRNFKNEECDLCINSIDFIVNMDNSDICLLDDMVLKYVFFNIFSNAIKAINRERLANKKAEHKINIRIKRDKDKLTIEVENDGEKLEHNGEYYFIPFKTKGGTGIGNPLSRSILKLYGAEINMENSATGVAVNILVKEE